MPKQTKPDYQSLKSELDAILSALQGGELDVDEALAKYKRGLELARQIEDYLKTARNEVHELKPKSSKRP